MTPPSEKAGRPPETDVERVQTWCEGRVPPALRDELRIECTRRGRTLTIAELRPPWRPELPGAEWTRARVAQLRWDADAGLWELYWSDRNERWWPYDGVGPTPNMTRLLRELEADPTCVFWG